MSEQKKVGLENKADEIVDQMLELPALIITTYASMIGSMALGRGAAMAASIRAGRTEGKFVGPNLLLIAASMFWCLFKTDALKERFDSDMAISALRAMTGLTEWSNVKQLLAQAAVIVIACHLSALLLAHSVFPEDAAKRQERREILLYQGAALLPLIPLIIWMLTLNLDFWSHHITSNSLWVVLIGVAGLGVAFIALSWLAKGMGIPADEAAANGLGDDFKNGAKSFLAMAFLAVMLLQFAHPLIFTNAEMPSGVVWETCEKDDNGVLHVWGLVVNGRKFPQLIEPERTLIMLRDGEGKFRPLKIDTGASLLPAVPTLLRPGEEIVVAGSVAAERLKDAGLSPGECRLSGSMIVKAKRDDRDTLAIVFPANDQPNP